MFSYAQPIRSIAWAKLQHAHGKAEDVPAMLEGLLSEDADTCADAYHAVISTLWHQGTIYQATGHAVPFLVDLVCSAEAPGRGRAVTALALIAVSAAYVQNDNEAHRQLVLAQLSKATPQLLATLKSEATLRPMIGVVLAQCADQCDVVESQLEADGLGDTLTIVRTAAKDHAAAFDLINMHSDESAAGEE